MLGTVAFGPRGHRRTEKELHRLAASMRHALTSRRAAPAPSSADAADTEVVGVVAEAAVAVVEALAVVFSGCAALSPNVLHRHGRLPASHGREDGEGGIESMTRGPHMSLRWRLRVKTAQRRSKQSCPRSDAKSERF